MVGLKKEKTFIEGDKVLLRAFKASDGKFLKQWLSNKEVSFFLEMSFRPYRDKEVRAFTKKALNSDSDIIFSVLKKVCLKVLRLIHDNYIFKKKFFLDDTCEYYVSGSLC